MAINELSNEIEKVQKERAQRYPLLDIQNSREEIRKISEDTIEYAGELYPSLAGINQWEIVVRTAIEFIDQYFQLAKSKQSVGKNEALVIGEFMTIEVEYGDSAGVADKEGTFNPKIVTGPELWYYNDDPSKNNIKKEPPVFDSDMQDQIDFVSKQAQNLCKAKYSLIFEDYRDIARIAFCFLRQTRQYLIDHKDDTSNSEFDFGMDIDLGVVLDIGIEKSDTADGIKYWIQFAPGQKFKVTAKDDDQTERGNNN